LDREKAEHFWKNLENQRCIKILYVDITGKIMLKGNKDVKL